jgi:hypothetical protein
MKFLPLFHKEYISPINTFKPDQVNKTPVMQLCFVLGQSAVLGQPVHVPFKAYSCVLPHEWATTIFEAALLLSCYCISKVILCFLSNHWPHSRPDSIVQTERTPLVPCTGRKHKSARIEASDFESSLNERILRS